MSAPAETLTPPATRLRAALYYVAPTDPAKAKALLQALRAFATSAGYLETVVYAEHIDDRRSPRRLRSLLKRARALGFDVVVVPAPGHLARTPAKVAQLVSDLGLPVVSMSGVRLDPATPTVRWLAAFGRRIRERSQRALAAMRARGERVGGIPFGSRLSANGVTVEPDEAEQTMVARVHELHASGESDRSIARMLTAERFTSRAGTSLTHVAVGRILRRLG